MTCGILSLLSFGVAIAAISGEADLRPALPDYLLLAAVCCRTSRDGSACEQGMPTATQVPLNTASAGTRHTFVSLMSDSGMAVEEIARLAGHSSSRTTEVVYRHELRPVITTGAEVMDQLFKAR